MPCEGSAQPGSSLMTKETIGDHAGYTSEEKTSEKNEDKEDEVRTGQRKKRKKKSYIHAHVHKKSCMQCQKKEGANPGQLFQAFGPHQQGVAQSLPGTARLK